jgi:Tol biopolymer transport system component
LDTKNGNFIALTDSGPYYQPAYSAPNLAPATPLDLGTFDLAFVSDRDGEFGIYVMDTTQPEQWHLLPRPSGFERAWWPTFCGDSLAYEAQDVDGLQPQWIYSANSGSVVPVKYPTTLEAARFGVPRCSAEGRQMAFSTYVPSVFDGWILGLKDFQTGEEFAFGNTPSFGYVSWSRLENFFLSMTIIDAEFYILQTTNFRNTPTVTTLAKGKYPALSPNGNQFVYLCANQSYLCLQEVSGTQVKLVNEVYSISIAGQSVPASAMWSGDGLWIYFSSAADGDWDIYRVRPDGSELQNLTEDWLSNELMPALNWGR